MLLTNFSTNLFKPKQPPTKPVMTIPFLNELRDSRSQAKVTEQCRKCSRQLVGHLYKWTEGSDIPSLKTWGQNTFLGVDLPLFQEYLMEHFILLTDDKKQWLLDPAIADRIYAACTADDSPLELASLAIERTKRKEYYDNEKHT